MLLFIWWVNIIARGSFMDGIVAERFFAKFQGYDYPSVEDWCVRVIKN